MKKYGKAGQDTHGNIVQRMRIACWMIRAAGTHSDYVILIALVYGNSGDANASHCYVYMYIACLFVNRVFHDFRA